MSNYWLFYKVLTRLDVQYKADKQFLSKSDHSHFLQVTGSYFVISGKVLQMLNSSKSNIFSVSVK